MSGRSQENPLTGKNSTSADAAKAEERALIRAMSARERVYLALELGRRAQALLERRIPEARG